MYLLAPAVIVLEECAQLLDYAKALEELAKYSETQHKMQSLSAHLREYCD